MTVVRLRTGWLPTLVAGVALASMLAFLWIRTPGRDTSGYFENVASLRQLKQLDARWELDVLKSGMGLQTDYDSLVDPLVEMDQLRSSLRSMLTSQSHNAAMALAAGGAELDQAMQDKTRFIEHFKSHDSLLRNSLAFLPAAVVDVETEVDRVSPSDRTALRPIVANVKDVLLDIMVYSHAPAEDKAAEATADLDRLAAAGEGAPPSVRRGLQIFSLHVRTVLREQAVVNGLLAGMAAVPTAAGIDALDNLLSAEQREASLRAQTSRQYLLLFAAGLVCLLAYTAVGLIRGHAVINRVNRELQIANTTLEQRVQERTQELHAAQDALVTTARHAGMAEIANNVLHNVGNVLNSVNVSAGIVTSKVRDSQTRGLAKAVRLLDEHASDLAFFLSKDERGKLLPAYLNGLAAALAAEQQDITNELGCLTKSVDHIKDIVAAQQTYAGASSVVEAVHVEELLEDALRMNADATARHKVVIDKEFAAEMPLMLLDKRRLVQIVVNLLNNAKQAMESVLDRPRQLTLGADLTPGTDGRMRLRIRVADAGEGIAAENLDRIFMHGFTTRKTGHGFGLHSCAIAAKEMGGTLGVHSEGPGRGATFTLVLPIDLPDATR